MRKESSSNFHNERVILHDCPFSRTLDALGNRWRAVILWKILMGVCRFGALQRAIPQISGKMLAYELRELEQRTLIYRSVQLERPLHVEYAPTIRGKTLQPILEQMFAWGEAQDEVVDLNTVANHS